MKNWKILLQEACEKTGDDYSSLITTLSVHDLNLMFDNNKYGEIKGNPFTAWSNKYVYFPVVYDGLEWVGYAPRNPCDISTKHQGSED